MADKRDVAVAVCNYNRRALILACIKSVLAQGDAAMPICVVDNASTDGSAEALTECFGERITLCHNSVNRGSSGGFAQSIAMAMATGARYVLVMDSDCVMGPGALDAMLDHLDRHPLVAVVGPKVYWANPAGIIQEVGAYLRWERAEFERNFGGRHEATDGVLTEVQHVDYVPACCLVVRSDAVSQWGNINPDFFLYFDDIEWCTRLRLGGALIDAVPTATAVHHGGGISRRNHGVTYYYWRNRLHFFRAYCPESYRVRLPDTLLGGAARATATCRVLGLDHAATAIERATADGLNGVWGSIDLASLGFLELDPPSRLLAPSTAPCARRSVEHVLEDVTEELASQPALTLVDPFGKCISADAAWRIRPEFLAERERCLKHFRSGWHR